MSWSRMHGDDRSAKPDPADDAAHACRETAQHIAGKKEDGGRESDYLLAGKGKASAESFAGIARDT